MQIKMPKLTGRDIHLGHLNILDVKKHCIDNNILGNNNFLLSQGKLIFLYTP